jgi:chemotaxis protein histidine kinase CheA
VRKSCFNVCFQILTTCTATQRAELAAEVECLQAETENHASDKQTLTSRVLRLEEELESQREAAEAEEKELERLYDERCEEADRLEEGSQRLTRYLMFLWRMLCERFSREEVGKLWDLMEAAEAADAKAETEEEAAAVVTAVKAAVAAEWEEAKTAAATAETEAAAEVVATAVTVTAVTAAAVTAAAAVEEQEVGELKDSEEEGEEEQGEEDEEEEEDEGEEEAEEELTSSSPSGLVSHLPEKSDMLVPLSSSFAAAKQACELVPPPDVDPDWDRHKIAVLGVPSSLQTCDLLNVFREKHGWEVAERRDVGVRAAPKEHAALSLADAPISTRVVFVRMRHSIDAIAAVTKKKINVNVVADIATGRRTRWGLVLRPWHAHHTVYDRRANTGVPAPRGGVGPATRLTAETLAQLGASLRPPRAADAGDDDAGSLWGGESAVGLLVHVESSSPS